MLARRRSALFLVLALSLLFGLSFYTISDLRVRNFLSYSTRPLWDKPSGPSVTVPHFYAEGVPFDDHLCALHGWKPRSAPVEVWDAVLISTELDLLEIRMNELDSVVSKFFVVESDRTFTGRPKNLTFTDNIERFRAFRPKLVHSVFSARVLKPGESPFENENAQRRHMDAELRAQWDPARGPAPLVIFSDADEIPSAHTIKLLRHCEAPTPLHLQMREYLYSFEWSAGDVSWRAQVHQLGATTSRYGHKQVTNVMLADSGWHCTFCFRHIDEFIAKMTGYSHADRVTYPALLEPKRIQETICTGKDIFGMLPEAYRWKDLLSLMEKDAVPSAVHVPAYLIQNSERFKFLLPGGCMRDP